MCNYVYQCCQAHWIPRNYSDWNSNLCSNMCSLEYIIYHISSLLWFEWKENETSFKTLMSSTICQNNEIVFRLTEYWGCLPFSKRWCYLPFSKILSPSSICQHIQVVFNLPKYWGFPFAKILKSSYICQNIEVLFHLPKYRGRLPFAKILR